MFENSGEKCISVPWSMVMNAQRKFVCLDMQVFAAIGSACISRTLGLLATKAARGKALCSCGSAYEAYLWYISGSVEYDVCAGFEFSDNRLGCFGVKPVPVLYGAWQSQCLDNVHLTQGSLIRVDRRSMLLWHFLVCTSRCYPRTVIRTCS